ncbi:hypothetical protein ANAPH2_00741 [Anaplasma phagocytophilum]|nr:hypothetical protein ANAPH2_00741 [Anaplasma phagocytophilum]
MMLLLDKLITLLLLLPKLLVKISFSLLRRLEFPTLPLMGRFVMGIMLPLQSIRTRKKNTLRTPRVAVQVEILLSVVV